MKVHEEIKKILFLTGEPINEIAQEIGVSESYLRKVLFGYRQISIIMADKLEKYYDKENKDKKSKNAEKMKMERILMKQLLEKIKEYKENKK